MSTDGGSQDLNPSPADAGTPPTQGGNSGGGSAPGTIPVELQVAADNLGIKLVAEKEWKERDRYYGSVKNGEISKKLAEYDKLKEADQKRKDGELSDIERANKQATDYKTAADAAAAEKSLLALRIGFMQENARRAVPDSKELAVFPELMETQLPGILAEFKGGDVDEFVKDGFAKLVDLQTKFAKRFGGGSPANAPGGAPISPTGAQGEPLPRKGGSIVDDAFNWRDNVAFTNNPKMPPTGGGKR